jgi:hypothetical protein
VSRCELDQGKFIPQFYHVLLNVSRNCGVDGSPRLSEKQKSTLLRLFDTGKDPLLDNTYILTSSSERWTISRRLLKVRPTTSSFYTV